MKKVCVIGPALKMGGVERESVNFVNNIPFNKYKVSFIALFSSTHFFKLDDNIQFFEPLDFNKHELELLKTLKWVRSVVTQVDPDVILVYNKVYGAIVSLALLFTKYNVFVSEVNSPLYSWRLKPKLINRIAFSIRPPKGVKAQTNISSNYLKEYYSRKTKISVIPNPLRKVQLYPELERKKWILAVGRFGDRLKGFDRLIDAYSKIKHKDWELVFAGGDEDGEYLKEQAARLGVLHRVRFLGKVAEIDKVYAQAGLFVMPSRSEGFPNALCEAMAAGLPCISFDFISGPRDMIVNNLNGILVEDGNIPAFSEAIDYLISNPAIRFYLGNNALEIRDKLEGSKISKQVLDFILE